MIGLLDVNVLVALFDPQHVDHRVAWRHLDANIESGWASCPFTQNGLVRVLSQPRYPNPITTAEAAARLAEACNGPRHTHWGCDLSLLDDRVFDHERILGPRQVTDVYLLATAVAKGGRLVTFDRSVPLHAVRAAHPEHLHVIGTS